MTHGPAVRMMHIVEMTPSEPSVTHVLPGGTRVTAVTSLGDHVFVVRWKNIRKEVEVYDSGTGTGPTLPLQRRIAVRALGPYSYGLAACASNECLYASDFDNNCVHRVELTGRNKVTWLSVGRRPAGLTVNSDKNVLVVIQGKRKLQQFTTHGSLLRTIRLERDRASQSSYPAVQWPVCDQPQRRHTASCVLSGRQRSSCSKLPIVRL